MNEPEREQRFDLERLLAIVRRHWWIVAVTFLVVTASALVFSLTRDEEYEATASLLFRNADLGQDIAGLGGGSSDDPDRQAATNVKLVQSTAVASRVARATGNLTTQEVKDRIEVSDEDQSNVVTISATDTNPVTAQQLANLYAEEFIAFRKEADRATIEEVKSSIQRQLDALPPEQRDSAAARSLQSRLEQLDVLASLQTGNAELIERATTPTSPVYPKTVLNLAIGAIVGLLLGLGLALLTERLWRKVRESDDLSQAYRLPVLAEVPDNPTMSTVREGGYFGPEDEVFRMLRARLRYSATNEELRSILVTSSAPQEGKSTVAWHLARAMAIGGQARVVLVEADLRRPTMAILHRLSLQPGLANYLLDEASLEEIVQRVPLAETDNGYRGVSMDAIVAGPTPHFPAELLDSRAMSNLLQELTEHYDHIVIDTPPALAVADAIPLMRQVDGVVVVSRVGSTPRRAAEQLRDQLRDIGAPVVGIVANRVKGPTAQRYGYGGYEQQPAATS